MTAPHLKNAFVGGELAPAVYGRSDLSKWANGASTMRNMFVSYKGGAYSRAGFAYVGKCLQDGSAEPPRDIPFQFSLNQGFVLEFGEQYMRVKYRGAYVTEGELDITDVTQANPGVFTYDNTDYSLADDDWIFIQDIDGPEELNGLTWIVYNHSGTTFSVKDLFGNPVDTSVMAAYVSGGTLARIYTAAAPYAAEDLPYLKFTQDKNILSLTCINQDTNTEYPPYDLSRRSNTDWEFVEAAFGTSIAAPTNLTATAKNSTTKDTWYSYSVTAVDAKTGQESVPSDPVSVQNNNISINAGSNTIRWNPVPGAGSYKIYTAVPSYDQEVAIGVNYGFIGTSLGTQFTDSNIVADFSTAPPTHDDPFARGKILSVDVTAAGSGYTQGTISYAITTTTGTGFSGTPVVVGGELAAFIVVNGGQGYAVTDTIEILSGSSQASGTYTFTANPANKKNIRLNGVNWTFVTSNPNKNQTLIGASLTVTLANLAADLNASNNKKINLASYSVAASVLTITYKVAGEQGNDYTLAAGSYGGTVSGANLTGGADGMGGDGGEAVLNVGADTGTYPGVVAYDQQRRVYGFSLNEPNTYHMSKPGSYLNFDVSDPTIDSDAITGTPWSQQVNGIQFMQPMTNGLITLTGSGAWLVNGGNAKAITPADQNADAQAYNGSSATVPPIVVNYDILYVQSKGSIVRDLSYNFFVNVYTGTDITVLSSHLFSYHQIYQWAYAEEPYKVVWAPRDDGSMLSLTYLKEQEVVAWARHDTQGFFVGVCSVTEPPVDAVYAITKRYIRGQWVYYSERADNRNWENVEDAFCVDSGLRYPMTYPEAVLSPSAANGTRNITSVIMIDGGSGYTNPVIEAVDDTGEGQDASFTATVINGVITKINVITEGEGYNPGATAIVISDPTGSGAAAYAVIQNEILFETDTAVFTSGDVGSVIRIGNNNAAALVSGTTVNGRGKAVITEYISSTEVKADVLEAITATIPDDPEETPVSCISGQWSLTAPVTVVSGLNHLEGKTLVAVADGGVVPGLVVANGRITLPYPASSIVAGLSFTCQLQTMPLEPPGQPSMQGKRKNIYATALRAEKSRGLSVGTNQPNQSTNPQGGNPEWSNMIPIKERTNLVTAGSAVPLFTGDHYANVPANWNENGMIAVEQKNPLPANILSCVFFYKSGDTSDGP